MCYTLEYITARYALARNGEKPWYRRTRRNSATAVIVALKIFSPRVASTVEMGHNPLRRPTSWPINISQDSTVPHCADFLNFTQLLPIYNVRKRVALEQYLYHIEDLDFEISVAPHHRRFNMRRERERHRRWHRRARETEKPCAKNTHYRRCMDGKRDA